MPGIFSKKGKTMSEEKKIKVFDEEIKETAEITPETQESEDAEPTGKGNYKLKKPVTIDGKTIDSIYYDLPSVTPIKIEMLIKNMERKQGYPAVTPMASAVVQIAIFSEACRIPAAILKSELLNIDYMNVCNLVFNYFFVQE